MHIKKLIAMPAIALAAGLGLVACSGGSGSGALGSSSSSSTPANTGSAPYQSPEAVAASEMEAIWAYSAPSSATTPCGRQSEWLTPNSLRAPMSTDLNAMAANATAAPGNVTPNIGSQVNADATALLTSISRGLPMPIDNSDFTSAISDFAQAGTAYQSGDKSGTNADLQAGTTALKAVLATINADGCQPPDGGTS
jgi:hypothetical protein